VIIVGHYKLLVVIHVWHTIPNEGGEMGRIIPLQWLHLVCIPFITSNCT